MSTCYELILLSPHRLPGQHSLMIAAEEAAAFLHGYTALWHPALLRQATGLPRVGSPYDFEQPRREHVFAVPDGPPLHLPEDWDQRVQAVGAAAFHSAADRKTTLENMAASIRPRQGSQTPSPPEPSSSPSDSWLACAQDRLAAFFGIAFGYVILDALFEAMNHDNPLINGEFWRDVHNAALAVDEPDPEVHRAYLQSAANRLLAARKVLYPAPIYLLDFCLLDAMAPAGIWPETFDKALPLNLIASGAVLERLKENHPEKLAALRERAAEGRAEVCGGTYLEREDAVLPVESQMWNLRKGVTVSREILGVDIHVFARRRFGFHPQLPLFLHHVGIQRALLWAFKDDVIPAYRSTVASWASVSGKEIDAFVRPPYISTDPQTYFHAAHHLYETIMQDHAATFAVLHDAAPSAPWHGDWLELSRLAPVLGQWTTVSQYLQDAAAGEFASPAQADDFHGDYLAERVAEHQSAPISGFAKHLRRRRRLDAVWTLAAFQRALAGRQDALPMDARLAEMEDRAEVAGPSSAVEPDWEAELHHVEKEAAEKLADRLLAHASAEQAGYLIVNPCSFARRVALELVGLTGPLPVAGPVKACQCDDKSAHLVIELPALGFAWLPNSGPPGTPAPTPRMRLADERHVRNEYFEAEIDLNTGGIRALRDYRNRANRLGQQLVFNPGGRMQCRNVAVTSNGSALGEIVSEGDLVDEHDRILATFRQYFRAWLGRPLLDVRIELDVKHRPEGDPWYAYYGARFAWGDERAALSRGVNGLTYTTSHTRPATPEFLEIRHGRQAVQIFPGGLPFHQRRGTRMVDVILVPEGEAEQTFHLSLGVDREYPMQTALGLVTPAIVVPTTMGPPAGGSTGWLFHLDAPNLVLTSLRPADDGENAVIAHLLESSNYRFPAELRCVRNPRRAFLLDAAGNVQQDASVQADAVRVELDPGSMAALRVEFE